MKAIRGAISVSANTVEAIHEATRELLQEIARRNALDMEQVVSVFFSLTDDLNADFPAHAARTIGWKVPMLDTREVMVPGALPRCLRVLLHVESDGPIQHVYLREAVTLRPDLSSPQ